MQCDLLKSCIEEHLGQSMLQETELLPVMLFII